MNGITLGLCQCDTEPCDWAPQMKDEQQVFYVTDLFVRYNRYYKMTVNNICM